MDIEKMKKKCICKPGQSKHLEKAIGDATLSDKGIDPNESPCKVCRKKCLGVPAKGTENQKSTEDLAEEAQLLQYIQEETEKLMKLKDNVIIAQKSIADIQEQLRVLERLFEDYNTVNTSRGQVNPAVLYKEIMKPQSVPFINPSLTSQIQLKSSCICISEHTSVTSAQLSINQSKSINIQSEGNVSVLSAVPLS